MNIWRWSTFFSLSIFNATLRIATPICIAALGRIVTSLAGIVNIAVEGMMLIAAYTAVVASYYSGSALVGVLAGILAGVFVALLMGALILELDADARVVGTAINIGALGLTTFLLRSMFGVAGAFSSEKIIGLKLINSDALYSVPVIGPILNGHTVITYIALFLVALSFIVIYWTPTGLRLRAVGLNLSSAEAVGIDGKRMKYMALVVCGALCGLAGAYLSLGYLTMFTENMIGGRGFIAVAASLLARNNPIGVLMSALLFGYADVISVRLQMRTMVPAQLILITPYALTLITLVLSSDRFRLGRSLKPGGAKRTKNAA